MRGGNDTDTVAAIAGGLLGAAYGASAVPVGWRRMLHGWPGMRTRDLVALVNRIVEVDKAFSYHTDSMMRVRHPHDDGVWLADVATLLTLPPVRALIRAGADQCGQLRIDQRLINRLGKVERQDDMLRSTLASYLKAMGVTASLVVELGDHHVTYDLTAGKGRDDGPD